MTKQASSLEPTHEMSSGKKRTLWEALIIGFKKFIWDDLREGMIDLKGLPWLTGGVIRLGFLLLGIILLSILLNAYLRSQSALIPLINSSSFAPGRGMLLPTLLAPLTLVCVTFAWTFILSGAVHSHPAARLGILFLFLLAASWQIVTLAIIATTMSIGAYDFVLFGVELVAVGVIPLLFLVLGRAQLNRVLEFCMLLFFTALAFLIPQIRSALLTRYTGLQLGQLYLTMSVQDLFMIALPLLLQIGFDIADFTRQASRWVADTATSLLPRWGPGAVLLAVLGWQLYSGVIEEIGRVGRNGAFAELLEYAGALGILICVILIMMLVNWQGRSNKDEPANDEKVADSIGKITFMLIIVFEIPYLLNYLLGGVGRIILIPAFVEGVLKISNFIMDKATTWYLVVAFGAFCLALWRARRGEKIIPLYLGIFGLSYIYYNLTGPTGMLSMLEWRGVLPVNLWWQVLLTGVSIIMLARRQLASERAGALAFLVFITFLVGETDFISDPFSPIFGFAGVGFIVFGIVWDTLTRGAWVNSSSQSFSRTSRAFLYFGYIILTATLVNWTVSTHDLQTLNALTGKAAMAGFERFGKPMLYVIYVLTLSQLFKPGERALDTETIIHKQG